MKKFSIAVVVIALLGWTSASKAAIIGWDAAADGDGAVTCEPSCDQGLYDLTILGNQYWGPGHINGSFTTDTDLDPTVRVRNAIDNDTTFAWTGYCVNISMNKTFTLSDALVNAPGDWSAVMTQPVLTGGLWVGSVNYSAGTPIAINGTFDFGYKMAFLGSVLYCQEMTPVPEPASLALLGTAGLGLLVYAWRRRRS